MDLCGFWLSIVSYECVRDWLMFLISLVFWCVSYSRVLGQRGFVVHLLSVYLCFGLVV